LARKRAGVFKRYLMKGSNNNLQASWKKTKRFGEMIRHVLPKMLFESAKLQ